MKLSGLHILLTYQCTFECDHCFVWGGPHQRGVLRLEQVEEILEQAKEAGVESVYFEGGEPFLYYALLVKGVHRAAEMGFSVGNRFQRVLGDERAGCSGMAATVRGAYLRPDSEQRPVPL